MEYYEKSIHKSARDERHINLIGSGESVLFVGALFVRWINQADRSCRVFAMKGAFYAYDYEMPAGDVFFRIGNRNTQKERTTSLAALPTWARKKIPQEGSA